MNVTMTRDEIRAEDQTIHYRQITALRPLTASDAQPEMDAPSTRILYGSGQVDVPISFRRVMSWYEQARP